MGAAKVNPYNEQMMNKRLAEQELLVVEMHLKIEEQKKIINEIEIQEAELRAKSHEIEKYNGLAKEILNEIWTDLNTGNETITLKSYRKLEELCS